MSMGQWCAGDVETGAVPSVPGRGEVRMSRCRCECGFDLWLCRGGVVVLAIIIEVLALRQLSQDSSSVLT